MKTFTRLVMAAALFLPSSLVAAEPEVAPAVAETAALTPDQTKAIQEIVHQYIMDNPNVIIESLQKAREQEQDRQAEAAKKAVMANKDQLDKDPQTIIAGNPKGDVTVVEFFDYQCGYCKSAQPMVESLLQEDKNVRFIFKEFPILSETSVKAARAALAARTQGKYVEFHNALMKNSARLDENEIYRVAKAVGLNIEKLKKDMEDPAIQKILDSTSNLARTMEIRGTPAFIIGDQLVPGAIALEDMKRMVENQRKANEKPETATP